MTSGSRVPGAARLTLPAAGVPARTSRSVAADVAAAVVRARVSGANWHAALVPCPWLTGAALTLAALYAVLADGPPGTPPGAGRLGARTDAAHERAQLAVLAVPAIGLSLLSVAVTYRQPDALLATASVSILILYGVAAVSSADKLVGGRLCFPLIGAVTGLVVAPAAGAITGLRALGPPAVTTGTAAPGHPGGPPWLPLAVTAGAAAAGAATALALRHRPRAAVLAGLAVAAEDSWPPMSPGPSRAARYWPGCACRWPPA